MMKPIDKKILTGAIAAAFLIGGVGLLHNTQANAAATPTGATVVQNTDSSANVHGKRGLELNLTKETATILSVDPTTITDQLKQGKTLVQIAQAKGITEDVLLQKLTDAENQSIAAALASGKITQAQADKMKSGLAARLKKEVEQVEKNGGHEKGRFGAFGDQAALSQILGVTQQQLKADLQAGKSIAEIAQAKGITEDQLINKIKDGMTAKLKQFVEKKDTPEAGDTPDSATAQ
jgi:predicted transcriptional regulator